MRQLAWSLALGALLFASGARAARGEHVGHGALSLSLGAFATPPELAMFGAEVARAVAGELAKAGVEVTTSGLVVAGRMEALDRDRVRLSATVAGRQVQAEGLLEQVDVLATELAGKLLATLPQSFHRVAGIHHVEHAAATKKAPAGTPEPTASVAPAPKAPATSITVPATVTPSVPVPEPVAAAITAATTPTAKVEPEPIDFRPQPIGLPPPTPPPTPTLVVPPPAVVVMPPARMRGPLRVVLHEVALPGGCPRYNSATFAARRALEHIGGLRILPGGCGIADPTAALSESVRVGAAAVVMASLEWIGFVPEGRSYRAEGRFRLVVVRDGRTALNSAANVAAAPVPRPDSAQAAFDLTAVGFARFGAAVEKAMSTEAGAPGAGDGDGR